MKNYRKHRMGIKEYVQWFVRNVVHRYRVLFSILQCRFLRLQGADLDKTVMIYGRIKVVGNVSNLSIGAHTKINDNVIINCLGRVTIGKRVHLSAGCQIHSSGLGVLETNRIHMVSDTIVSDDVWICAGAIVLKGVEIGKGSIVSANSVVSEPVPNGVIFHQGEIKKILEKKNDEITS